MKRNFIKINLLLFFCMIIGHDVMSQTCTSCSGQRYNYALKWGSTGTGNNQFNDPTAIAIDASGNIFVTDANNNRVIKFDNTGSYVTKWGTSGSGNSQFNSPKGIAMDASGNVYVVDQGNSRIQKFDNSGTFITKWGSFGSGNGQFSTPVGIAIDASSYVYVVDANNSRIQRFNSTGTYSNQWGTSGSGNGQFNQPIGIAASGNYIYVTDQLNNRVQKFLYSTSDATAYYWGQWGTVGSGGDGNLNAPWGVAVDASGSVYVTDQGNNRVQKFTTSGYLFTEATYITQFGSYGTSDGQFNAPKGIALDASCNLYVVDYGNDRIQKFSLATGTPTISSFSPSNGAIGSTVTITGTGFTDAASVSFNGVNATLFKVNSSTQITAIVPANASTGNITVIAGSCTSVTSSSIYSVTGNFCSRCSSSYSLQWGSSGSGNGQFNGPATVAIDGSDNVYISDANNNRIEKFNSTGGYIAKWGSSGSGNGQFNAPKGLAVDASGNIYVADQGNHRIQKFNSSGSFIRKWGSSGSGNGQFDNPVGIAVDGFGNVYVTDNNQRVQKFDSTGNYLLKWGSSGSGNGKFNQPVGIAVDAAGNVYVVDQLNNRIQKFKSNGTFLSKFGTYGTGGYEFNNPWGIAVNGAGDIYIVDQSNNRVEIIHNTDGYIYTIGSSGSGNGQFSSPKGIAINSSCDIFVVDYGNNRIQKFATSINPVITSVIPSSGPIGSTVTLKGFNFTGVNSIKLGTAVVSSYTIDSPIQITATIPTGAFTGNSFEILNTNNCGTNGPTFTITPTRLSADLATLNISVYPNPSKGSVNVIVPKIDNFDIVLYNTLGEVVLRDHSSSEEYLINNQNLAEGMYILNIVKDGEVNKIKLMITK